MENKFKIIYLPVARKDLIEIVHYINNDLNAPISANNLLNEIEIAILRLADFPFSCPQYFGDKNLKNDYRYLAVKNYIIFYVIFKNTVEIRRIIYARRNINTIIN